MKKVTIGLFLLLSLSACSKSTQEGALIDSAGHHAAGWAAVTGGKHPAAYLANPDLCIQCHGDPTKPSDATAIAGGIAKVSCFAASFSGLSCHATGPIGHDPGFAAPDVHGVRAKSAATGANGMAFCKGCHGPGYRGVGAAKDCIGCHQLANPGPNAVTGVLTNAPHSPAPWRGSGRTHTNTDPSNAAACAQCHTAGANLKTPLLTSYQGGSPGCFNQTLCHGPVGHSDTSTFPSPTLPWANPLNHGARARYQPNQNDGFSFCQTCHGGQGADFNGGSAQVSCLNSCHGVPAPHPSKADWRPAAGSYSHVNVDQIDPALTDVGTSNAPVCASCHNAAVSNLSSPFQERFAASPAGSFKAGVAPGCFNASLCHGDTKNDCSVCHGYATVSNSVPFQNLSGATSQTNAKVGAHVPHLAAATQVSPFGSAISANIGCAQCHPVPTAPAPGATHRNGTTNFLFGALATANGTLTPVVASDPSSGSVTCANVYCHGATIPGGSNSTPRWNDTSYLSANGCGTCHGFPPNIAAHSGVLATTLCNGCHPHVNAANNGFIDPTKHINGVIDVSAGAAPHPFPNPGSLHKAGVPSGCTGCHALSGTTNPYPVAAGSPPNCRACHLNANPSADPSCSDCHGDAATGRPSGSSFPNTAGRHSNPGAHAQVCSTCHAGGGTGVATHGNSNGVVRTAADVVLNATAAGITITRNPATGAVTCSGTCHTGNENHGAPPGRTW